MNQSRHKQNQPPSGQGKKQRTSLGSTNKLNKRSEVAQAQRGHEQNLGTSDDEMGVRSGAAGERNNPNRTKAGR